MIRDGKVAVLYSPGHGAGWYTWHKIEGLLYDPRIVEMVERGADADEIQEYCETAYDPKEYYGGADQLAIAWVPRGSFYRVHEYDGYEVVQMPDELDWKQA